LSRRRRVHVVGIGGPGMNAIATCLVQMGHDVTGSDIRESDVVDRMRALGIRVNVGHDAEVVTDREVVTSSTAIPTDNIERVRARSLGVPDLTRADMLAALCSRRRSIAVAGTHGKTTTSSMMTVALQACGVDPSFAIGGILKSSGSNAHRGSGKFFVAEADESDGSFVAYRPHAAVITNVEWDHVDHFASEAAVFNAFDDFVKTISGFLVYCADDNGAKEVAAKATVKTIGYGKSTEATLRIDQIFLSASGSTARVLWKGAKIGTLELSVPGEHNVLNAAAVLAVGLELGLPASSLLDGLVKFHGAGRRFELKGAVNGIRVIDDYGHHPTEIKVTLEAAKRYAGGGRVLVIFQPHRYSRTKAFINQFAEALSLADKTWLLEVYAASEQPISGVSSANIAKILTNSSFEPNFISVTEAVAAEAKPGDVIITLGAGDVSSIGPLIIEELHKHYDPAS
ncbi:MAG: hypothetical protein RL581_844, partial [Actinomycetota bacterium]